MEKENQHFITFCVPPVSGFQVGLERETTASPLAALEASAATAQVVVVEAMEETVALVEVWTRFPIVTCVLLKFKEMNTLLKSRFEIQGIKIMKSVSGSNCENLLYAIFFAGGFGGNFYSNDGYGGNYSHSGSVDWWGN